MGRKTIQKAGLPLALVALAAAAAAQVAPSPSSPFAPAGLEFEWLPDLPNPVGLGGPLTGVHGGALIVAGGANFPKPLAEGGAKVWHDQIYVLLSGSGEWIEAGHLPRPLAYASCVSTDLGVLVAGGSDADAVHGDSFLMVWDEHARRVTCEALAPLPEPSAFGSAGSDGTSVYVLGGKRSKDDGDLSGAAWRMALDGAGSGQGAWETIAPLPGPARFKAVAASQKDADGRPAWFVFSGSRMDRDSAGRPQYSAFTDGFVFRPGEGEWEPVAGLPPLADPRGVDPAGAFAGAPWPISAGVAHAAGARTILTFGGATERYVHDEDGGIRPPAERPPFAGRVLAYDVVDDRWSEAGAMPIGVVTTGAAVWGNAIVVPSGEVRPGIRTPRVQALGLPGPPTPEAAVRLSGLDYLVLGLYLLAMVGVGVYFSRRESSTEEFFLAGRRIPWWAAGLSIFGTQLSAITFMAIPATAYGSDWRRFAGQLMVLPVFLIVIAWFLPVFRRLDVTTAYEFLEERFSRGLRLVASGLFILFQLGRMGIVLLLPAIALSAVTGMPTYGCIALMGVLATAYTALGGMAAVIWTDVVQVFVLVGGALMCLVVATTGAGGPGAAIDAAELANKLQVFDWRWSTTDMVGWVVIVGFFFTNLVPFTTDQTVIQRYLTTKNEREAAKSLWLNFAMTIPTGLLFFGLGTALWAFYEAQVGLDAGARSLLPQQVVDKPDQLVPWFVVSELPAGLAGLVIAGIFAAAMSSLDSSMNSITTAIVNDFVAPKGSESEDRGYLRLARGLTIVLGVVGTGAAMLLATFEIRYLFDAFQKILGLFGGGVAGVFLLAVFAPRVHAKGAALGLAAGASLTLAAAFRTDIHFLLYAVIGTVTCVLVGWLTSLLGGRSRVASTP